MTRKTRRCYDKKKAFSRIMIFGGISLVILVLLSVPIGESLFLLIDKYHDCYQNFIIDHHLKGNNYYDTPTWLSVTATLDAALISALPGFIFGFLALLQTWRLHKLEARYHSPALEIECFELNFAETDRIFEGNQYHLSGFDKRQRYGLQEAKKQSSPWWIDMSAQLYVGNGIPIKSMEIESVTFSFPDAGSPKRKYTLSLRESNNLLSGIRRFERTFQNSRAVYTLTWSLNPFVLIPARRKSAFESDIREFVNYNWSHDPGLMRMELTANIIIAYDHADNRTKKCQLRIAFNANENNKATAANSSEPHKYLFDKESVDGYITYEV